MIIYTCKACKRYFSSNPKYRRPLEVPEGHFFYLSGVTKTYQLGLWSRTVTLIEVFSHTEDLSNDRTNT